MEQLENLSTHTDEHRRAASNAEVLSRDFMELMACCGWYDVLFDSDDNADWTATWHRGVLTWHLPHQPGRQEHQVFGWIAETPCSLAEAERRTIAMGFALHSSDVGDAAQFDAGIPSDSPTFAQHRDIGSGFELLVEWRSDTLIWNVTGRTISGRVTEGPVDLNTAGDELRGLGIDPHLSARLDAGAGRLEAQANARHQRNQHERNGLLAAIRAHVAAGGYVPAPVKGRWSPVEEDGAEALVALIARPEYPDTLRGGPVERWRAQLHLNDLRCSGLVHEVSRHRNHRRIRVLVPANASGAAS